MLPPVSQEHEAQHMVRRHLEQDWKTLENCLCSKQKRTESGGWIKECKYMWIWISFVQNCTVLQFANSWLSLKDLSEVGWQTLLEELDNDNDNDGKISLSEFEALRTFDIYRKVFRTNWCLAFVWCTKRIKTDTSFFTYSLQLADTAEYSSIFTWWQIEYWSTGKLLGTDMVLHKILSLWVDFCFRK